MYQSAYSLRIILFVSFVAVCCFIGIPTVAVVLINMHDTLNSEKIQHLKSVAASRTDQLENLLRVRKEKLNLVSSRTQLRLSLRKINKSGDLTLMPKVRRILKDAKQSTKTMRHISIIGLDGKIIASTQESRAGSDLSNWDEFNHGLKEEKVHSVRNSGNSPVISVTSPMLLEGEPIGIAWSEMDFPEINTLALDATGLGETGEILIIGDAGIPEPVFLAPTRSHKNIAFQVPGSEKQLMLFNRVLESRSLTVVSEPFYDYRNKQVLAVYKSIPHLNWGLLAKMDLDEIKQPISRSWNTLFAVVLILLIPFLALIGWLSTSLTRALFRSEVETQSIFSAAGECIALIDANANIINLNNAVEEIFGYAKDDLLGKPITTLVPPEQHNVYSRMLQTLCTKKNLKPFRNVELKGYTSEHRTIPLEISISQPSYHENIHLIIIGRDISLRKKDEERVLKAMTRQEELIETQRQFVNIASHEFRTPISIISNAIQHIERSNEQSDRDYILSKTGKIRFAVGLMLQLIQRTMSLANIDQGRFSLDIKSCNLTELIRNVCSYHQDLSKNHDIEFEIEDIPTTIKADALAIEQALSNLIDNAVKYSPESHKIKVKASSKEDHIVITIQDFGFGIDEDEQKRVFDRFFRSNNSTGISGTGIGLYLVKLLIDMHEGEITLDSVKGQGSVFTIMLPKAGPSSTVAVAEEAAA